MRIGIDAKWYFTGPVSTRVILQNLLPLLLKKYPDQEWVFFLDKKDKAKQLYFDHHNAELVYVPVPNNMLANLFVLPYFARRLKLDLVFSQTFPAIKNRFKNISIIYDVLFEEHPEYFTWKERLYFSSLKWFTKNTDRIIVNSSSVAADLLKHNYATASSKIDLIPLGVGKQYQPLSNHNSTLVDQVRKKYHLPSSFILFVGRLNARKNIEALLKCLPLLEDKAIKLLIVGKEDWKEGDLKEVIKNPDIGNRVRLTGEISDEELVILYSMATIFCFPSFAEGFGLPPLEAMASGVPVVVSETTSLPEVCGDAALYIDPHQPQSIAKMIDLLLQDKALYAELRMKGLERASGFTWEKTACKLMESIKSVGNN
jgi:glycosyltransferase involved in cell wall biosynthesis